MVDDLEHSWSATAGIKEDEVDDVKTTYGSDSSVEINYKDCSWQRTAGLLFSEYICLAIMSFPGSYSTLGLVPGLILTVGISLIVLYTGLTIGEYCLAYPGITSVCDIGEHLFGYRWAWYASAVGFILNNLFISALHVLVASEYFNTMSTDKSICSVVFGVCGMLACFLMSLPRTFSSLSFVGIFSAATMFIAVVLAMAFAGVQAHPNGYAKLHEPVSWNLWPAEGTTYVQGMSAMLNILYTFVGQITYPSFISEMKEPKDFKKALYLVTICELIVFSLAGSIVYVYVGNAYMVSPAFGALTGNFKKISFSFALPTLIFLGSLYGNVSAKFLFSNFFRKSPRHIYSHTVKGWTSWVLINLVLWVIAFVIAEVIPFFSDLLSLMSSLFDCWFGFIFWGIAYFRLRKYDYSRKGVYDIKPLELFKRAGFFQKLEMAFNVLLIGIGIYILVLGLYATISSIVDSYKANLYGSAFSCAYNGI